MGASTYDCLSTSGLSFRRGQASALKLLMLFLFTLSCISSAVAAPLDSEAASLSPHDKRDVGLPAESSQQPRSPAPLPAAEASEDDNFLGTVEYYVQKRSAGLAWGPVNIGNL